eukprot:TRINITY_DN6001_c0_g1_i17.p1 TRINITY_DN6001_c0_g1~~TRINITY_DN6001_c0_g1_i17.p1  ORF type:complete len:269 (+),score=12.94 TRINITY_DN6001_c0_g1_i17:317-1123(+)
MHKQVRSTVKKVLLRGGVLWGQSLNIPTGSEILEFGVWQGNNINELVRGIREEHNFDVQYKSIYYKYISDPWCPSNQPGVSFGTFEPKPEDKADYVISANGLSFVPNITRYLEHIISLIKPNGTAILIEDPYFFGFRGHRMYGQWFQNIHSQFACKNGEQLFAQHDLIQDYIQLTHNQVELEKEVNKIVGSCSEATRQITEFIQKQVSRRVPLEQFCANITNLGKVSVQAIRLFHNDTSNKFQTLIEERWQHAQYNGDAVVLIIKHKL